MQVVTRFLLLSLVLLTTPLFAQWSSDPNVNLAVCDTSGSQELPKLARTSDGGCYISWFDTRTSAYRVYMQRLNAQGVKQWGVNGLLVSANPQNTSLVDYELIADDSNYAVVVFTDIRGGGQIEPWAYRISPQGTFVWGANGVGLSTSSSTFQANPKVVETSDKNFVFAWIYSSTPRKVAMQKLNSAGVKQWGTDPILLGGTGTELYDYPALAPSDNGSVILMNSGYTGSFLNPGNYRIYTQKYSPAGAPLWGASPDTVYGLGRVAGFFVPKLIPDGNNGAFYVWQDDRGSTNNSYSYVQHITSTDTKLFPVNGTAGSTLTGRLHNDASIAYTPVTGETYMFWYETDALFQNSYGVYGQKFSSTGVRQWPDSGKAFRPLNSNQPSFIRSAGRDSSAVVFFFDGVTTVNNLVKGFRVDRNGNLLWGGSIINVSSVASSKGRLTGATTPNGISLLTWSDGRQDGNGVYGQNVNFDGTLGNAVVAIPPTISAIARNVRVPNAGDTLVVTARIVDSTGVGISADSLWYSLNGGSALKVVMPRVSGTNTDGTYRGVIPGSANANGNRVEYQVWANGGGGTTTTAIAAANSYFAGISPISPSGVAAQDSLLVSRYKGYYVRVTGTINGPNFQAANLSEYFQDAFGGLNLFKTGSLTAVRNLGDSVIVLGKLDQFRGVREIVPDTVDVDIHTVATGRPIPVINLTVGQYMANPELYESRVIQFSGLNRKYATPPWPPAATQATIVMYQASQTDTVVMFINAGTNIPGTTEPSYPVNMICLGSQFAASGGATQGGYEVLPRYMTDFSNQATGWTVQTSGTSSYLYSVKAVSQNVAWAAGAAGTVLRTVDHGVTWTSVGGGAIGTADIYNIDAVDANVALVTTSPAATFIYRTTNGGTSWTQVYTDAGSGAFIDAIHMFNATNGVAYGDPVGGKWVLIYTSNGGSSWVRDTVNAPAQVGGEAGTQNGLCAVGTNNIWFNSGVGGRIYRTTNGGTLWTSGIAPFTATSNVWFNNALYGVATGSTASGIARSTDGGATWSSVTVAGTGFLIACSGSGTTDFWYARGTTIYRSTDKGASFTSSYVGTGSIVALSFVTYGANTSGWAATSTGNILSYYGTVTSVREDHNGTLPTTFALQQNYPNPFNPTTTIRYSLPQSARVTLTVYNILGQRIAELANEVESPGFYTSVWDGKGASGSQVATGVYFYRMEATPVDGAAPFTSLKKMLLVK